MGVTLAQNSLSDVQDQIHLWGFPDVLGTTRHLLICLFSEMFVDDTWVLGIITVCRS